ncbi:cation:dicarboxylate symporter family transporter [Sphingomonas sp. MMS24-JH45]
MIYMTFALIFIAQAYGIDMSIGQMVTMLLVLMVTSKGIAGVPRASLVVIAATLPMFNLPEAGLLLDPRDRPFPRHGAHRDQRDRQCGREHGGKVGGRVRSARAGRDRAAFRAER